MNRMSGGGVSPADRAALEAWLLRWTACIATDDRDAARDLFDPLVLGFGTVAVRADGLEDLLRSQWGRVWCRTRGFRFLLETLSCWHGDGLHSLAVQWESTGLAADSGEPFLRRGRATVVLCGRGDGLRAVHTHFSVDPLPERFLAAVSAETAR